MNHLTAGQLQSLTEMMDARFAREMEEIGAIHARARDADDDAPAIPADRLDVALAEVADAADRAVLEQDIEDVRDILAARRRVAAGGYGICIDCGADIPYRRLLAYPTAKRCIDCQRAHEDRRLPVEARRAL